MTSAPTFEIQGRTITFPVEVRRAQSWAVQYLVNATAVQRLVAPAGLEVVRLPLRRAMCSLAVVRYEDSDLDTYHEVAVAFLVRPPGGDPGIYIHHLPVDQSFTLEAGREIWGYPKFMATIEIVEDAARMACVLSEDGVHILTLAVRGGGRLPVPQRDLPSYSFRDGVVRRTPWVMRADHRAARFGGAEITLGPHPIADELRSIGLPKRALMSSSMRNMHATFGPAELMHSAQHRQ